MPTLHTQLRRNPRSATEGQKRALLTYEITRILVRSTETEKGSGHQDQDGKNRTFVY